MRTLDLFAGCGGLSLGFHNAGFDVIAAFDNWELAIEIYRSNFSNCEIKKLDLKNGATNLDIFKRYEPEVIIGGPPCQDFSSAGKRNEKMGRADLTISFAKIIDFAKPKYFVMENVDRILKSNTLKNAIMLFKESGYGLTWKVLDSSFYGVPQKRKRFFLVGALNTADDFLQPYLDIKLSSKPTSVKEYLGNKININYYYRHPWSYGRRAIFSVDEPSPTIRGVNRPIPKGYQGHPNDAAPVSNEIRALTTYERSLIQTFPENFIWKGTKTEIEQLIGNAVPVKLAEFVATALKLYIEEINKIESKSWSISFPEMSAQQ